MVCAPCLAVAFLVGGSHRWRWATWLMAFRYHWYSEKCQVLVPQPLIPFTRRQQLNHRRKMRKHEHKFADADMRITSPWKECSHSVPKIVNNETMLNGPRKAISTFHEAKYEPLIPISTGVCFTGKRSTRACNTDITVYTRISHNEWRNISPHFKPSQHAFEAPWVYGQK